MPEEIYHVAFCADDAFVQHTAVAIRSLIDNVSNPKRLQIWLLDAGISSLSCALISAISNESGVPIDFIQVPLALNTTPLADRHVSPATYGRLFLPEILDSSIETCLYLDGDVIVLEDILKLSKIDLQDKWIASVDDFYVTRNKALRIPASVRYFNAGVVVLNLAKWRKEGISRKILAYAANHPKMLLYHDQDAMNALLYGKHLSLPLRWNQQRHFDDHLQCMPGGGNEKEMSEAMSNPAIVHYVGPEKPWHYLCLHPHKKLYFKYRERTPWFGFTLPEPEELHKYFSGKRIVIFGAGRAGSKTIQLYRKYGCYPEYLLDNDVLKAGHMLDGLPIHAPSYLLHENPDRMVIVIASMFRNEIKEQLKDMGFNEFRHFVIRGFENHLLIV